MSKPKILYIIGHLGRGGAEQQLYYLLKYLNYKATVLSLSPNGYWSEPIRKLGHEVIELPRRSHADITRLWAATKLIKAQEPDIIHIFLDGRSGFYGRAAAFINRHPCVIVGERCHPSLDQVWYGFIKRYWLNRHVSMIVTNSRSSENYLIAHDKLPANKVRFIPNGIDQDRYGVVGDESPIMESVPPGTWQDKVIIGTVASLDVRKDPECYLRVARLVLDNFGDVRFIHVGDGPMRGRVEQLCTRLNLGEYVKFCGERGDVSSLLNSMDIFVLTSRYEGMPNAVMEAMAMGIPCVVTDAGDCSELVSDGVTGFVVPRGAERELADRILMLARSETLRHRMGQQGQGRIRGFEVHTMVSQYRRLYGEVCHKYGTVEAKPPF